MINSFIFSVTLIMIINVINEKVSDYEHTKFLGYFLAISRFRVFVEVTSLMIQKGVTYDLYVLLCHNRKDFLKLMQEILKFKEHNNRFEVYLKLPFHKRH